MKKDTIILILLLIVSATLTFSVGMLWRSEQVIRLIMTIEKQRAVFLQTEEYLNNLTPYFDDNSIQVWGLLGYKISRKDSINLKTIKE